MTTQFEALFAPSSIAVLGVSGDPQKLGSRVLSNLATTFTGRLAGVNSRLRTSTDVLVVERVSDLAWAPDLTVVALPRRAAAAAALEAARSGARFISMFTSGLGEREDGTADQQELAAAVRTEGARLLGPNCVGTISVPAGANATFGVISPDPANPATIALVTQSGALGLQITQALDLRGRGIVHLVTTGNEADLTAPEVAAAVVGRPEVQAVGLVIETLKDRAWYVALAEAAAAAAKPVIVLRLGTTSSGQRAAASHTGSLAVPATLMSALTSHLGFIEATSLEDFVTTLALASCLGTPSGTRVGVVTGSGGLGILAADAAEANGLSMPSLPPGLHETLAEELPDFASLENPVDYTAHIMSDQALMASVTSRVIANADYDMVCVAQMSGGLEQSAREVIIEAMANGPAAAIACTQEPETARLLGQRGVATVYDPVQAMSAYSRLHRGACRRAGLRHAAHPAPLVALPQNQVVLPMARARELLAPLPVEWPREALVHRPEDAVGLLAQVERDIVLKVDSDVVAHKSDVGAIALSLGTPEAVAAADARLRSVFGDSPLIAQEMAPRGLELVVGALRDPQLGAFVLVGLGGRDVEIVGQQCLLPAPLTPREAHQALVEAYGGRLMANSRGLPPRSVSGVVALLVALGDLVSERSDVVEVDLNPVIVTADQMFVVDALVAVASLTSASSAGPSTVSP